MMALFVFRLGHLCSAVGVFVTPQNPSTDKEPLTLRARQAHSRRVPQLRRFRARSERRGRVLLCRVAFGSYCGTATGSVPKVRAPACRSVRASANDKIENEEVAPRVTPVAAARRSRPYPRAHPLLRIGDPSPYAPSPALPSIDPSTLPYKMLPTVYQTRLRTLSCVRHVFSWRSDYSAQNTKVKPQHKKTSKHPHFQPFYTYTSRSEHPNPS
jgi:hypothetical protein